tara:strand:- start:240 stop:1052 length:813 start_codon:yes stop_codon:yes gene_type:complete
MNNYILTIDSRESKLIELIKNVEINNFSKEFKSLEVGDIIISKRNENESDIYKNIILIFERKTCKDLLSSINDGRYREQKARLISNFSKTQICYIIEDNLSQSLNKYRKNGRQIVLGALVNKSFRDKLNILKTSSLDETLEFLLNICKKVVNNPEFFEITQTPTNTQPNSDYLSSIKITKKDNITPERFSILSLSIIPGVSPKISEAIIEWFGSLKNLILEGNVDSIENQNYNKTILKIANIEINITGGKKRKVGKVIGARIINMLFAQQ